MRIKQSNWAEAKKFIEALGIDKNRVARTWDFKRGNESPKHFFVKSLTFYMLVEEGHKVLAEVECKEIGAVADILDLTTQTVIEVERGLTPEVKSKKMEQYMDSAIKDVFFLDVDRLSNDYEELLRQIGYVLGY